MEPHGEAPGYEPDQPAPINTKEMQDPLPIYGDHNLPADQEERKKVLEAELDILLHGMKEVSFEMQRFEAGQKFLPRAHEIQRQAEYVHRVEKIDTQARSLEDLLRSESRDWSPQEKREAQNTVARLDQTVQELYKKIDSSLPGNSSSIDEAVAAVRFARGASLSAEYFQRHWHRMNEVLQAAYDQLDSMSPDGRPAVRELGIVGYEDFNI